MTTQPSHSEALREAAAKLILELRKDQYTWKPAPLIQRRAANMIEKLLPTRPAIDAAGEDACKHDGKPCYVGRDTDDAHYRCGTSACHPTPAADLEEQAREGVACEVTDRGRLRVSKIAAYDAAAKVLRDWRLSTIGQADEPSEGWPLVDALSPEGGDITPGYEECGEIAFAIIEAIAALGSGGRGA